MRVLAFRISALGVALTALACGPAIELEGDATTGGDGGTLEPTSGDAPPSVSTSGPTPPPPPGTATAPPPGTSTVTSATTASTGDSDTWDTGDDCGCNFLCDPCWDGCRNEPIPGCDGDGLECDLFAQDCPEGEKCMPWANDGGVAWNATRCSPIDPSPAVPSEPCQVEGSNVSGIDDCAIGSMCWDVDPETNTGTCAALCGGSADNPVCADGQACFIGNDGTLPLCLPTCNPLAGDCAEGHGCFPTGGDALVCLPAPSPQVVAAGTCAHSGGCEPGTVCVGSDVLPTCDDPLGCCTRWCDLNNPVCTGGLECQPFFEAGDDPLGVCVG